MPVSYFSVFFVSNSTNRGGGKSRCNSRCSSNSPRTRTTGEQPKDKENCGVAQKCAEREDQRKTTRWAGCVAGGTHRPRTWSSVDLIAQLCDEVTNLAWRPEATKSENRLNFDAWSGKPPRGRGSHTGGSVHVAAAARCAREQNGKRAHQGDTFEGAHWPAATATDRSISISTIRCRCMTA